MSDVLDYQVGGDHYDMPIQPADFILKNGLGWAEGNAIKYLCRYKRKGSPVQDLKKAKHYIEMLIEQLEPERDTWLRDALEASLGDNARWKECR